MEAAPLYLTYEVLYPAGSFGPLEEVWLRERLLHTLHLMEGQPGVTINRLGTSRAERMGAYRMLENEDVSFQQLLEPAARTVGKAVAKGQAGEVALCVHDRTEVELSHLSMSGVGQVGNPVCQGFFLQTALVVQADGAAFGVLGARTWARPAAQRGKAKSRKQRPFEQKESGLWWQAMVEAEEGVDEPGRLLHVIDAEGDIFELFSRSASASYQLLVRAGQDRRVEGEGGRLWATMEGLPVVDSRLLHVSAQPARADKPARTARDATLVLRYVPLTLLPPGRQGGQPVPVWGVLVREEEPPQGQKAVEWLLLSNVPIESVEAAWGAVSTYQKRWGIEELHKALKTGCRLEGRQHQRREHLENLLVLTLLVSVKMLRLRTLSRTLPDEPADEVLEPAEVQVLQAMAPQLSPRMRLQGALTLRQALLLIAALGGYMANPDKKPPGWLVLWRGYERLGDYVAGFTLAQHLSSAPPPT
ncbi:IS4 family transposase [Archangium lansingense]|uniref:IS4 family transposase n=1 Tax=Archangium lansingense TaxID=2995310 RepID=A0ABT4A8P1_9BACT|nr:IS4 family transposase [Archangium lansinium]MCY1077966.1 IS4 family transposase [Archangium lansinium]